MPPKYLTLGVPATELSPTNLNSPWASKVYNALRKNRDFEFLEFRNGSDLSNKTVILIVNCINDQIPSKTSVGINVRERLALVFSLDRLHPIEVRALRYDFPILPHLNHTETGSPVSLCLYAEPWESIKRTWTGEKFLQRISWWLIQSANGKLHHPEQEVEAIYFDPHYQILLPYNFEEKITDPNLILTLVPNKSSDSIPKFLWTQFTSLDESLKQPLPSFTPIALTLEPIVHGRIERFPTTLGELSVQLGNRGISIIDKLSVQIGKIIPDKGIEARTDSYCILVLQIPIKRKPEDQNIERFDNRAFIIQSNLALLGKSLGVLCEFYGRFYNDYNPISEDKKNSVEDKWMDIKLEIAGVRSHLTQKVVRSASGINEQSASFKGILAGLGALGGSMAELWAKEAYGQWTYIDFDCLEPHNLIRHIGKDLWIGENKAKVVKRLVEYNYENGSYIAEAITGSITDFGNEKIRQTMLEADFLVEATTAVGVPRDLSRQDNICRCASVFLSPSAKGSVLLVEDQERKIRLDCLEAQYYRAIIRNEWGKNFLTDSVGKMPVGSGCSDISTVFPYELVQLHAAILARQTRKFRESHQAYIGIWSIDDDLGSVSSFSIPACQPRVENVNDWRVVSDQGVIEYLSKMRQKELPNESGGVILGFIDQTSNTIYVVDIFPPPKDSIKKTNGFVRGKEDLLEDVKKIHEQTAGVVNYIGEWHSHPPFCSPMPSQLDNKLLDILSEELSADGLPVLMMIVGIAGEISFSLKEQK